MQRLQGALDEGSLSAQARDEVAELLWEAALQFEEGNLADAAERLRRAQEMLNEAMRRGASEDEISELMQELREALDDYMRQLAEQQRESGEPLAEADPNAQAMGEDQLQQLLDQIEELMQQGRMDEAQALLDQLMEMMENMQVAEGEGGQQGDSPGEQSMEELQDTLREQQELADDAFRELQEGQPRRQGPQPGQQQQQQGQEGQQGEQGQQGQQGQGQQQGQQGQGQEGQEGENGQAGQGGQQQPGQGQQAKAISRVSLWRTRWQIDSLPCAVFWKASGATCPVPEPKRAITPARLWAGRAKRWMTRQRRWNKANWAKRSTTNRVQLMRCVRECRIWARCLRRSKTVR